MKNVQYICHIVKGMCASLAGYGISARDSTSCYVYSYEILLLEMFMGRRTADFMFIDGLNFHSFASPFPEQIKDIMDKDKSHGGVMLKIKAMEMLGHCHQSCHPMLKESLSE